jgi:hypothetical protein
MDTYGILVAIGAVPKVANVFQRNYLRLAESPGGLFRERVPTEFGLAADRPVTFAGARRWRVESAT